MRRITSSRVPAVAFGAGIAVVLAFGASSAVAAPGKAAAAWYFCGYHDSYDSCERCCGELPASWDLIECYCETEA